MLKSCPITKVAAFEHDVYEGDFVIGKKLAYDSVELRRLAVKHNLFGRFGCVRGVPCLMLWNECENWENMLDKVLVLLDVPDYGLITQGNTEQWWVRSWRKR